MRGGEGPALPSTPQQLSGLARSALASGGLSLWGEALAPRLAKDEQMPHQLRATLHTALETAWANGTREVLGHRSAERQQTPGGPEPGPSPSPPLYSSTADGGVELPTTPRAAAAPPRDASSPILSTVGALPTDVTGRELCDCCVMFPGWPSRDGADRSFCSSTGWRDWCRSCCGGLHALCAHLRLESPGWRPCLDPAPQATLAASPHHLAACSSRLVRTARAILLYHYMPYDKTVWACLQSPTWLSLALASAWPTAPVLRSLLFGVLLAALAQDGDAYQLTMYIVAIKASQCGMCFLELLLRLPWCFFTAVIASLPAEAASTAIGPQSAHCASLFFCEALVLIAAKRLLPRAKPLSGSSVVGRVLGFLLDADFWESRAIGTSGHREVDSPSVDTNVVPTMHRDSRALHAGSRTTASKIHSSPVVRGVHLRRDAMDVRRVPSIRSSSTVPSTRCLGGLIMGASHSSDVPGMNLRVAPAVFTEAFIDAFGSSTNVAHEFEHEASQTSLSNLLLTPVNALPLTFNSLHASNDALAPGASGSPPLPPWSPTDVSHGAPQYAIPESASDLPQSSSSDKIRSTASPRSTPSPPPSPLLPPSFVVGVAQTQTSVHGTGRRTLEPVYDGGLLDDVGRHGMPLRTPTAVLAAERPPIRIARPRQPAVAMAAGPSTASAPLHSHPPHKPRNPAEVPAAVVVPNRDPSHRVKLLLRYNCRCVAVVAGAALLCITFIASQRGLLPVGPTFRGQSDPALPNRGVAVNAITSVDGVVNTTIDAPHEPFTISFGHAFTSMTAAIWERLAHGGAFAWRLTITLFVMRQLLGLLALPFALFILPPMRGILTTLEPTGYDRRGACRLRDLNGLSAGLGYLQPLLRSQRIRAQFTPTELRRIDMAVASASDMLRKHPDAPKHVTDRRREELDALLTSLILPGHPLFSVLFPQRELLSHHRKARLATNERHAPRDLRMASKYGVVWQPDSMQRSCRICHSTFTLLHRRHHCRACGQVICDSCSSRRAVVRGSIAPKRVCDICAALPAHLASGEESTEMPPRIASMLRGSCCTDMV